MSVAVVIVAGGAGFRAGGELPKQYQLIGGRPVIWWTLKAFVDHPGVSHVQTVIGAGHGDLFAEAIAGLKVAPPVIGGDTRQDSCRLGIAACTGAGLQKVLIHDAARPFVSADLISHVIAELDRSEGVVPGLPVADTMKFAPGGLVERTVDRQGLWGVQTPQGFDLKAILVAHEKAYDQDLGGLTDDAAVAEKFGITVRVIAGRTENRKLTTAEDIREADQFLMAKVNSDRPDVRVGQGIDFHEFEAGDGVVLCGIKIPHDKKLKGHSDADAAMHALTDAILGALGEGDIGTFFPPSDARWKGISSKVFLQKAVELMVARHGIIANVDITILAEAPRVGPHIAGMKALLSPLLHVAPDRIAIKATTTEKLGAIGRREGLAAFATATVRLP
ncbi:MAG TPA: bifunctional 2-C-methyl-D-erythritol 4-phosphate cytidylyltransferase/2-C-methyl-D-erythritol 2,4-cyclodiphosphate synthase [Aestuariivirga sp.]